MYGQISLKSNTDQIMKGPKMLDSNNAQILKYIFFTQIKFKSNRQTNIFSQIKYLSNWTTDIFLKSNNNQLKQT